MLSSCKGGQTIVKRCPTIVKRSFWCVAEQRLSNRKVFKNSLFPTFVSPSVPYDPPLPSFPYGPERESRSCPPRLSRMQLSGNPGLCFVCVLFFCLPNKLNSKTMVSISQITERQTWIPAQRHTGMTGGARHTGMTEGTRHTGMTEGTRHTAMTE